MQDSGVKEEEEEELRSLDLDQTRQWTVGPFPVVKMTG